MNHVNCDIADKSLAPRGKLRIEWADRQMPVLQLIRRRFEQTTPLAGERIACCLHVTSETANLVRTLKAGGAQVALCASNPLSTQDEVAASLVEDFGVSVFAICGEDRDTYYRHVNQVLDIEPTITIDDGADLINTLHTSRTSIIAGIRAGMEETTTGVIRLRAMATTAPAKAPLTASCGPPTSCWQARPSSSAATVNAGGAWRCAPAAWGQMSSWWRSAPWLPCRPPWTVTASCPSPRPRASAISS